MQIINDKVTVFEINLCEAGFGPLQHLFDTIRLYRRILVDVRTENNVSVVRLIALFIRLIVSQFIEDGLRHIGVQVIDEDVLRHS
jgi:hypothetical protein